MLKTYYLIILFLCITLTIFPMNQCLAPASSKKLINWEEIHEKALIIYKTQNSSELTVPILYHMLLNNGFPFGNRISKKTHLRVGDKLIREWVLLSSGLKIEEIKNKNLIDFANISPEVFQETFNIQTLEKITKKVIEIIDEVHDVRKYYPEHLKTIFHWNQIIHIITELGLIVPALNPKVVPNLITFLNEYLKNIKGNYAKQIIEVFIEKLQKPPYGTDETILKSSRLINVAN